MLIGSKSLKTKAYFSLKTSDSLKIFSYDTIWFFPQLTYMDLKYKLTISKTQLIKRNYSILFFALNLLSAFIMIPITLLNKRGVLIFYNLYALILTAMGLLGALRLASNNMLIFFMGKFVVTGIFTIMFLYTIFNRGIGDGQIFYVYLPIVLDVLFFVIHLSLVMPILMWMLKSQKDHVEIEFDEIPKKAVNLKANNKGSEAEFESVIPSNRSTTMESLKMESMDTDRLDVSISSSYSDDVGIKLHNNDSTGDNTCVICTVEKKAGAFYPCGHLCCCNECGVRFKKSKCPYCRKHVDDFIKLYEV